MFGVLRRCEKDILRYTSSVRRVFLNGLLFLAVLLLMLLLAEGAWRLLFSRGDVHRVYDPELGRVNPPHAEWVMRTPEYVTHIRTNSRGFRGPEFPEERTEDEVRILFIGDSFVEAKQVEEEDRFVEQVGNALADRWHRPVVTRALGVGGADPAKELLFYRNLGREFDPDIVVQVLFPENDLPLRHGHYTVSHREGVLTLESIWPEVAPSCDWKCRFLQKSELVRRMYLLMRHVQRESKDTALPTLLGDFFWYTTEGQQVMQEERLPLLSLFTGTLQQEVEADGAEFFAVLIPGAFEMYETWRDEAIEQYGSVPQDIWNPSGVLDLVGEEFTEKKIPFVDLRSAFHAQVREGEFLHYKLDSHLHERGHGTVTDVLVEELTKIL